MLEGVAFSLRDTLRDLRRARRAGAPACAWAAAARVRRSGAQIQADVYGHAVETVEADEGAAYGAAMLAGVGAGVWPTVDAACDAVVRTKDVTTPDAAAATVLDQRYAEFQRVYPALRTVLSGALLAPRPESDLPMSDVVCTSSGTQVLVWSLDRRQSRARSVRRRGAARARPVDAVALLGEVGAWGVNLHDNDLVPIDATPAERDRIVTEFKTRLRRSTASSCRWRR